MSNYTLPENMKAFSENLRRLRVEHYESQADLARYLNVTRGAINAWETGVCCAQATTMVQIASHYNVSLDELCGILPKSVVSLSGLTESEADSVRRYVAQLRSQHLKLKDINHSG